MYKLQGLVRLSGLGSRYNYDIDGFLILHSGHCEPWPTVRIERNEGVGIMLDPDMVVCWRNGGEVWNPVSSRVVYARLNLGLDKFVPRSSYATPFYVSSQCLCSYS